jgi:hypothetical protein
MARVNCRIHASWEPTWLSEFVYHLLLPLVVIGLPPRTAGRICAKFVRVKVWVE